jgi:hypothetical protein
MLHPPYSKKAFWWFVLVWLARSMVKINKQTYKQASLASNQPKTNQTYACACADGSREAGRRLLHACACADRIQDEDERSRVQPTLPRAVKATVDVHSIPDLDCHHSRRMDCNDPVVEPPASYPRGYSKALNRGSYTPTWKPHVADFSGEARRCRWR